MMRTLIAWPGRRVQVMVVLMLVGLVSACVAGQKTPEMTRAGGVAPQEIGADVSCGKCGMFPAKYPQWQAQVVFADGNMTPFDGCKCMFGFLFDMGKYDTTHAREDVAAVLVKDFNRGEWFNAEAAYFVVGSNVMGPMGKELIPFEDQAAAMSFHEANGGSIERYETINMATLKPLMGGMKQMSMDKKMEMGKGSTM